MGISNAVKYSASNEAGSLKINYGNLYEGIYLHVEKRDSTTRNAGPTANTGFYAGITPVSGGYTVYIDKASEGPAVYTINDDVDLVKFTNRYFNASFNRPEQCLEFFNGFSTVACINADYPTIITDNLISLADAGFTPSYPRTGSEMFSVSSPLGASQHYSLVNTPTWVDTEQGSFLLNGTNQYLRTQTSLGITGNAERTIECWIYPTVAGKINIFGYGSNQTLSYFDLNMIDDGGLNRIVGNYGGTSTFPSLPGTSMINLNQWNQVVHVYGSSETPGVVGNFGKVYTNGTFQNEIQVDLTTTNGQLLVGTGIVPQSTSQYFQGNISIVMVYDRALTTSEINQNYSAIKVRYGL